MYDDSIYFHANKLIFCFAFNLRISRFRLRDLRCGTILCATPSSGCSQRFFIRNQRWKETRNLLGISTIIWSFLHRRLLGHERASEMNEKEVCNKWKQTEQYKRPQIVHARQSKQPIRDPNQPFTEIIRMPRVAPKTDSTGRWWCFLSVCDPPICQLSVGDVFNRKTNNPKQRRCNTTNQRRRRSSSVIGNQI